MVFKTIVRKLNGKPALFVDSAGAGFGCGEAWVHVRFGRNKFSIKASQWERLPPWLGPYALVETEKRNEVEERTTTLQNWRVFHWSDLAKDA